VVVEPEPTGPRRRKRRSVVGTNRLRNSELLKRGLDDTLDVRSRRLDKELGAKQIARVRVDERQHVAPRAVLRRNLPLKSMHYTALGASQLLNGAVTGRGVRRRLRRGLVSP